MMPLTDLLLTILAISLFCVGMFQVTRRGAVFGIAERAFDGLVDMEERVKNQRRIGLPVVGKHSALAALRFALTPLIGCCKCMASVWGVAVYWVLYGITWEGLPHLTLACVSASGVNALLLRLVEGRP